MGANRSLQRGVSLSGLLASAVIIGVVAVLGMKVVPDVIEYFKVMSAIKAVAGDNGLKGATVSDIRMAFQRRAIVDNIDAIGPQDIDVSKEGNDIVLSFSYSKRIPLVNRVSLVIDFEGSTAK